MLVVLFFDCNAALNCEGVGSNVDLVINLVSSGALVPSTDGVDLVKLVGNLFVVGLGDGKGSTGVFSGCG